jgi:hypothetical protein
MVGKRSAIKEIPLGGKVAYGMLAASLPLAFFLGRADHDSHANEKSVIPADIVPGESSTEGSPGSHLPTPSASDADEPSDAPESPIADEDEQPATEPEQASPSPSQSLAEAKATGTPGKPGKAAHKPHKKHKHAKAGKPKQTAKPKPPKKPVRAKPKQPDKPKSNKGPLTAFIEDTTGISIPDELNPLHMFLARVSDAPLAVSYDEHADTVTMVATITDETAVQVDVSGAEECSRKDPATVTAQTVDPETQEPTGEPVTVDVTNPDNLSGAGIAAAVEAVLTDAEEPRLPDTSSD